MSLTATLAHRLKNTERTLVVTGAGISAESGVSTFRGEGGYWKRFRAEDLASPEGFAKDPELVWQWYTERRESLREKTPNPGHDALAMLPTYLKEVTLVTQNVDGLHRLADVSRFKDYVEIHGNIWRVKCRRTGKKWFHPAPFSETVPHCKCGALLRPDVLWFGETYAQDNMQRGLNAARQADNVLIIGTSGMVWIVAGLLAEAMPEAYAVEFNLERTELSDTVDLSLMGPAGVTLPKLIQELQKIA